MTMVVSDLIKKLDDQISHYQARLAKDNNTALQMRLQELINLRDKMKSVPANTNIVLDTKKQTA